MPPKRKATSSTAVLDRLFDDGLNVERTRAALRRDFLLDVSAGFVYDCLDWRLRQLDLPQRRRRTLGRFSARCASMSCTWASTPCCWPPTRWPTRSSASPWCAPTTRRTCDASSWG
jgi:hypothetical protein